MFAHKGASGLVGGIMALAECRHHTPHLVEQLTTASEAMWSGEIQLRKRDHLEGLVVLNRGRVAWAVSGEAHEDLGTFLWRLGRITKKQIRQVRLQYESLGGTQGLGLLLERAGLIREPVLRRCILLHNRMALTSLLDQPPLEPIWRAKTPDVDESMTFGLEEVLPEWGEYAAKGGEPSVKPQWKSWSRHNRVLAPLADVPGYQASAVLNAAGEVLTAHVGQGAHDPSQLGLLLASTLKTASRMSSPLGGVETLFLECEQGVVIARWHDATRRRLVVALGSAGTQLGMVRLRLKTVSESLAQVFGPPLTGLA